MSLQQTREFYSEKICNEMNEKESTKKKGKKKIQREAYSQGTEFSRIISSISLTASIWI